MGRALTYCERCGRQVVRGCERCRDYPIEDVFRPIPDQQRFHGSHQPAPEDSEIAGRSGLLTGNIVARREDIRRHCSGSQHQGILRIQRSLVSGL